MTRSDFERMVEEAVAELPARFDAALANVRFAVEDEPSAEDLSAAGLDPHRDSLFGLFDGVPLDERSGADIVEMPDRIVLFYRPIVRTFRTRWAIRREIRKTVIHEVAHLFGLDEAQVADEGYA